MNKSLVITVASAMIVISILFIAKGITGSSRESPPEVKSVEAQGLGGVSESTSVELKYFWSAYCAICKKQDPILAEILMEHPSLKFTRVDTSQKESVSEMEKYSVFGTPSFVLVDNESAEVVVGFLEREQLSRFICQKLDDAVCGNARKIRVEGGGKAPEDVPVVSGGGFCR